MNSIFQCLARLLPAFLDDTYKDMVNRGNTLGTKGEVAEAYAEVVQDIFSGSLGLVVPKKMSKVGGKKGLALFWFHGREITELELL